MINFSLVILPGSTITLADLWEQTLAAVVTELVFCGYTVDEVSNAKAGGERTVRTYRVDPGGATMRAFINTTDGSVRFVLDGDGFAMSSPARETDPVLWMRLVQLGIELGESYAVRPSVSDPDFALGMRSVMPPSDTPDRIVGEDAAPPPHVSDAG